jgi:hypothetical protein
MKTEFEKASDEASKHHGKNWADDMPEEAMFALTHAHQKGADWAYEWMTESGNHLGLFGGSLQKILDEVKRDKRIIQRLKEGLEHYSCQHCLSGDFECYNYKSCKTLKEVAELEGGEG